jgi:4-hydroxy-3-methylbut-2-enyl diphosphate reductase
MCFGVRDAVEKAMSQANPVSITIWGELVRNEDVLAGLRARGFAMRGETERAALPDTAAVLITAHGVSDRERARLLAAGKRLVDTTCPLVRRVHEAARRLQADGCHVVVVGRHGHVEVEGITGDLTSFDVVADPSEVRTWPSERIGVVCQSTVMAETARAVVAEIERQNPRARVRVVDTICDPTKQRVLALEDILPRVDAVVVVGGRNSNNTRQLVALCERNGKRACHVQCAADLDPAWFAGCETVGLTAGTSTPDWTIHEVCHRLWSLPETAATAKE